MAEYKGLTITLDGDAKPLKRALKNADQAVKATTREINVLNRALRLDPTNTLAMVKSLEHLENKVESLANKAAITKTRMRKLGAIELQGRYGAGIKNVADLSRVTKNASLEAKNATYNYENLVQKINGFYTTLKKKYPKLDFSNKNKKRYELVEQLYNEDKQNTDAKKKRKISDADFEAYKRNVEQFRKVSKELKDLNKVVEYQQTAANVVHDRANAKGAALAAANQATKAAFTKRFANVTAELSRMDNALGKTQSRLDKLKISLDVAPTKAVRADYARALSEQLDIARTKAQGLKRSLELKNNKGLVQQAKDAENLTLRLERLNQEYVKLSAKKAREDERIAQPGQKPEAIERAKESAAKLTARLKEVKQEIETLGRLDGTRNLTDELTTSTARAKELAKELAAVKFSGLNSRLDAMDRAGNWLTTRVTAPLMLVGYRAATAADAVDKSFRNMTKTVNGTEEDFQRLKKSALDFSTTHITSAEQILEIEAMGGQLGVSVKNLEKFATVVSSLDIATDIDAQKIAQYIGQLSNIMGDFNQDSDLENFANSLVRLGNNMPALESDIIEVAMRMSAMGNIVGMTTHDVLGWSAAIASTGQKSEAAGTGIVKTISTINSVVQNGGKAIKRGGATIEEFAKVAQMSAQEFTQAWKTDPSKALKAFIDGLAQTGAQADKIMQELGIDAVRQKQTLAGMAATADNVGKALSMSKNAWFGITDTFGGAGDAAREAQKKSEGFSGALQMLKNQAAVLGSELATSTTPFLKSLSQTIGDITRAFTALPDAVKQNIVSFGLFAAAAGPLLKLGATLGRVFTTLGTKFLTIREGLKTARTLQATSTLAKAGSNVKPFEAVTQELTAAQAKVKTTSAAFTGALKSINAQAATTATGVGGAFTSIKNKIVSTTTSLKGAFPGFFASLKAGLIGAGITLAVAAIGAMVEKYQAAQRRVEEFKAAQAALKEATENTVSGFKRQAATIKTSSEKLKDFEKSIQEVKDTTLKVSDSLNTNRKDYEQHADNLDILARKMDSFIRNGAKTADQKAELTRVAAELTQATGHTITVIDAEKGVIRDETDAINLNIDALTRLTQKKKEAYKKDMIAKSLAEVERSQMQAAKERSQILADYQKKQAEIDAMPDATYSQQARKTQALNELYEIGEKLGQVTALWRENKDARAKLMQEDLEVTEGYARRLADLILMNTGQTPEQVQEVVSSLEAMIGATVDLGSVTDEQKEKIALAYADWVNSADGSADELKAVLAGIGVKFQETSAYMSETWYQNLTGLQQLTFDALTQQLGITQEKLTQIQDATSLSAGTVAQNLIKGYQDGSLKAGASLDEIVKVVSSKSEEVTTQAKDASDKTTDSLSKIGDGAQGAVTSNISGIKVALTNGLSDAYSTVTSYEAKINSKLASIGKAQSKAASMSSNLTLNSYIGQRRSAPVSYLDGYMQRMSTPGYINPEMFLSMNSRPQTRAALMQTQDKSYTSDFSIAGVRSIKDSFTYASTYATPTAAYSLQDLQDAIRYAVATASDRAATEIKTLRRELGKTIANNAPVRVMTEREVARYIGRVTL